MKLHLTQILQALHAIHIDQSRSQRIGIVFRDQGVVTEQKGLKKN